MMNVTQAATTILFFVSFALAGCNTTKTNEVVGDAPETSLFQGELDKEMIKDFENSNIFCKYLNLSGHAARARIPRTAGLANFGPGVAVISTPDDRMFRLYLKPSDGVIEILAGDSRYSYFIEPKLNSEATRVAVCDLTG